MLLELFVFVHAQFDKLSMNVRQAKNFFFVGFLSLLNALNGSPAFFEAFGQSGVKVPSDGLLFGIELVVESLGGGFKFLIDSLSELWKDLVEIV